MNLRVLPLVATLLIAPLMSGCFVYRIDIQQGNEITEEMVAQLKIGMSKRDVTRLIGYPLINDPFHKDRWDYFYSLKTGKTGDVVKQRASLHFENDQLARIDSSFLVQE